MFVNYFLILKKFGIPVTINEWLTLLEALEEGLANASLETFYYLSRAILVKNETFFDRFDLAFGHFFQGLKVEQAVLDEILKGLKEVDPLILTEAEKRLLERHSLQEVLENFRRQYEEGHFKEHVGGDKAIGAGGRSTQGAYGYNPAGLRIGQDGGRHGNAIQIADRRYFRNYSSEFVLDTRNVRVALSKLRTLLPEGPENELDLDSTIDKTCRNAGELELAWQKDKRNRIKLLILMDVGGSMEPYHHAVSRLFSAAKSQFRDLKFLYFHNCVYHDLWTDIEREEAEPTEQVLKKYTDDYKVIYIGDASMAPSEMLDQNGAIDYFYYNDVPGVWWLYKLAKKFRSSVWLNPVRSRSWNQIFSTRLIGKVFPMFELTIEGLDEAVKTLLKPSRPMIMKEEIDAIASYRSSSFYSRY